TRPCGQSRKLSGMSRPGKPPARREPAGRPARFAVSSHGNHAGRRKPDGARMTAAQTPAPSWRPWHGPARARDIACCLCIAVSAVYAVAMIPLTPELIASHPVLLEMLSGGNSAIVAAGSFSAVQGKFHLAVVIAAALPGMLRFDWVIWWAGR